MAAAGLASYWLSDGKIIFYVNAQSTGIVLWGCIGAGRNAGDSPKLNHRNHQKGPCRQTTKAPAKPGAAKPATNRLISGRSDHRQTEDELCAGHEPGANLRAQAVDGRPAVMLQGIKRCDRRNQKMAMTEDEMKAAINKLQADLRVKQEAKRKEMEESRKTGGEANKKRWRSLPGRQ